MGIFQAFSKLDLYLSSLHWLFLSLAAFADLLWFFVYKEVIIYWYLHGVINLSEMSGTTSGTMHSKHIITAFRTKAKFTNLQSSLTSLEPHDLMYTCKSQTCHLHTSIVSPYASPSAWNAILFFNGLANLKGQLLWEVLLGLIPRTPKDPGSSLYCTHCDKSCLPPNFKHIQNTGFCLNSQPFEHRRN